MLTRSRNLLILAGLCLGASLAADHVPAIARHYDSHVKAAGRGADCPYHRSQAAAHRVNAIARGSSGSSSVPPEGSIFSLGQSGVFAP